MRLAGRLHRLGPHQPHRPPLSATSAATAELLRPVTPESGTLVTNVRITRVASSAGMIIQDFDFDLRDDAGPLYRGTTTFGFFSATALAQQVGLRDVRLQEPTVQERTRGQSFAYPRQPPYPDEMLGMIDQVDLLAAGRRSAGPGPRSGQQGRPAGGMVLQGALLSGPCLPGVAGAGIVPATGEGCGGAALAARAGNAVSWPTSAERIAGSIAARSCRRTGA